MIISKSRINYNTISLGTFIAGKGLLKLLGEMSNTVDAFLLPPKSVVCALKIKRSARQHMAVSSLTNLAGERIFEQKVRHKVKNQKMPIGTEYFLNQDGEVFCISSKDEGNVGNFSDFLSETEKIGLLTPVLHVCSEKMMFLKGLLHSLILADNNEDIFARRIGFYFNQTFYQTNPIALPTVLGIYLAEVIDNKLLKRFVEDQAIASLIWFHLSCIDTEMYTILAEFAPKLPVTVIKELLC